MCVLYVCVCVYISDGSMIFSFFGGGVNSVVISVRKMWCNFLLMKKKSVGKKNFILWSMAK